MIFAVIFLCSQIEEYKIKLNTNQEKSRQFVNILVSMKFAFDLMIIRNAKKKHFHDPIFQN